MKNCPATPPSPPPRPTPRVYNGSWQTDTSKKTPVRTEMQKKRASEGGEALLCANLNAEVISCHITETIMTRITSDSNVEAAPEKSSAKGTERERRTPNAQRRRAS